MTGKDEAGSEDRDKRPETAGLEGLARAAARFPRSALGRSDHLHRLFDYLLDRSLKSISVRELDIAIDIFGKTDSDLLTDASVRVYIHRLRKKIDEYYAGPGAAQGERMTVPKGEYRLTVEPRPAAPEASPSPLAQAPAARPGWRGAVLLLAGLATGIAATLALIGLTASDDGLNSVRRSAIWRPLLTAQRPLILAPGDYYIMGERDEPEMLPHRLVRDFEINSRTDLDRAVIRQPELQSRYVDLNLYYLPTGTGDAIGAMMRILAPSLSAEREAQVLTTSRLTAAQLRSSDIIFVGLLSGLGPLRKPIFGNSRFTVGASYDEVIDRKTRHIYAADPPRGVDVARRDFAYIAMVPGPNGNRILIVAGTRDPALLQAVDIMRTPAQLELLERTARSPYFEALYAVDGVGADRFQSRLLAAVPRATTGIWDAAITLPRNFAAPR